MVTLAVLSARRPSGVVIGACIGLVGVACAVALTGLPLAIVSQQIADRAMADLAAAQLRMLSLSAWATVLTLAAVLVSGSRVGGWLIATVATAIVSRFVPAGTPGSLAIVAAAVCAAGALAQQARPDLAASGGVATMTQSAAAVHVQTLVGSARARLRLARVHGSSRSRCR